MLTIGNISRNRFWGESDDKAMRSALCTSTLIRTKDTNILVDPSQETMELITTLDRRTGQKPATVGIVFLTHHHGDHLMGLSAFPNAKIILPRGEIELTKVTEAIPADDGDEIAPGVRVIALPGHTAATSGLLFTATEGRIAVVGDAVMTRDFFVARVGYFNSVDFQACAESHEKIARIADVVVPGHDNYFWVKYSKAD